MQARGYQKGLLVIDSFRGAFKLSGEQENQSGEAGVILRHLQEIGVRMGWLILVIHHHKKNANAEGSDNLSGTSDFGAAPNVIWTWDRPVDASKPGTLTLEGRIPPIESLTIRLSPDECTYLGVAGGAAQENQKARLLSVLANQKLTANELETITGIPYATIMKRLDTLREDEKIDFQRRKGKGSPKEWFRVLQEVRLDPPDLMSA